MAFTDDLLSFLQGYQKVPLTSAQGAQVGLSQQQLAQQAQAEQDQAKLAQAQLAQQGGQFGQTMQFQTEAQRQANALAQAQQRQAEQEQQFGQGITRQQLAYQQSPTAQAMMSLMSPQGMATSGSETDALKKQRAMQGGLHVQQSKTDTATRPAFDA